MIDGNLYRPIDPKTGSLSLEARHSISLEIARRRRQRFETSIFMPKTNAKQRTHSNKMSSDPETTPRSTRHKLYRKAKLQHPESFPVRSPANNRLPQRLALQDPKSEITNDFGAKGRNESIVSNDRIQKHDRQGIPHHYSLFASNLPNSTKPNRQSFVDRLGTPRDESPFRKRFDFENENNAKSPLQVFGRKSKLSSFKPFPANSDDLTTPVHNLPTSSSTSKMKHEFESREQSLLRMAIKAAQKARSGAAKLFTERDNSRNTPTPKLLLEEDSLSSKYFYMQSEAHKRHAGGMATKNEAKRTQNKAKVTKSKTPPGSPKNSALPSKAKEKLANAPSTTKDSNGEEKAESSFSDNDCQNYNQQCEPFYPYNQCNEMLARNEQPVTMGRNVQSPAMARTDNGYYYESMHPTCNYCCVQEEELTIEQANPTLPTANGTATECDATEWSPQNGMTQEFTAPYNRQTEIPNSNHAVGPFMPSDEVEGATGVADERCIPEKLSTIAEESQISPTNLKGLSQNVRSNENSLHKSFTNYMPQSEQVPPGLPIELCQHTLAQQQAMTMPMPPMPQMPPVPPMTPYNAEKRGEKQTGRQSTAQPGTSNPLQQAPMPPSISAPQGNPWLVGCNPNYCNQYGVCYGCNVCPPFGPPLYNTYLPWWYTPYPTNCCPPMDMIYPQLQQYQGPRHFYDSQSNSNYDRFNKDL